MLEKRLALEAAPQHTPTIGVISAFLGLAWITLILRFYTRLVLVKKFYPEDWVMCVTALLFTGYCASAITLSALVTQGEHKLLSIPDSLKATKLVLIVESFYIWSVLVLKISVGTFFLRIAQHSWLRIGTWTCMILSTIMGIALFLVTILQCGPFDDILIYVTMKLSGQCLASSSFAAVSYIHASITCLTDFIFVIMPAFILRKASMPRKEKIIAGGLLMLASASGIAAIVRFKYIDGISAPTETFFTTCTGVTIWSCLEPGIGIIAGSIICLRPFIRRHLGVLGHFSWHFSKKYSYDSSTAYTHELTEDTSVLKKSQGEPSQLETGASKTWLDPETPGIVDEDPVNPMDETKKSSESGKDITVVIDRKDSHVRSSGAGLPLAVFDDSRRDMPGPLRGNPT